MPKSFLISRLSSLGDVVCTLPAAATLKRGFSDCHITWVVDPRFAAIVECCSSVDRVITAKPGLNSKKWPRIEGEYDAALDLQGLLKSGIVVWRAKAETKLGFHWQREASWLFSRAVLPDPTSFHVVDQYVDVARFIGGVADRAEFNLAPKPEHCNSVKAKLEALGVREGYVVLNAGAGWASKRWPPEHCARLIDLLAAEGLTTALIGGKAESDRQVAEQVVQRCVNQPANITGNTSVGELVALIDGCRAHVGGDTGSSHIAAALGKPAIGLYSITRPERTAPYGQIARCHFDSQGLANIVPERVFESVIEALK